MHLQIWLFNELNQLNHKQFVHEKLAKSSSNKSFLSLFIRSRNFDTHFVAMQHALLLYMQRFLSINVLCFRQMARLEDDVYGFGFILLESLVGPSVSGRKDKLLLDELVCTETLNWSLFYLPSTRKFLKIISEQYSKPFLCPLIYYIAFLFLICSFRI